MWEASCVPERSASARPRWSWGTTGSSWLRAGAPGEAARGAASASRTAIPSTFTRTPSPPAPDAQPQLDPARTEEARRIRQRVEVGARVGEAGIIGAPRGVEHESVVEPGVEHVEHARERVRPQAQEPEPFLTTQVHDQDIRLPAAVGLEGRHRAELRLRRVGLPARGAEDHTGVELICPGR